MVFSFFQEILIIEDAGYFISLFCLLGIELHGLPLFFVLDKAFGVFKPRFVVGGNKDLIVRKVMFEYVKQR